MRSATDYQRAVRRYSLTVGVAGLVAFALFDATMGLALLCLMPHAVGIRATWGSAIGTGPLQALAGLAFFAVCSPPALLFLYVVVRRARRSPCLYCDSCQGELFTAPLRNSVLRSSRCPHCGEPAIDAVPQVSQAEYYEQTRQRHHRTLRFATIAFLLATPVMFAIMVWGKSLGAWPKASWGMVLVAPLLISGLFLGSLSWISASELAQLRRPPDARTREEQ
jgi:hypothetical protein